MRTLINSDFIRKHRVQGVLTVLGLSGVVLVFLPFGVPFITVWVPVESFLSSATTDGLGGVMLVGPFVVLPFFVSAGYLRWVVTGGLSRWEIWLGYVVALMVVVPVLLSMIQAWWADVDDGLFWLIFSFLALGHGAGVWFVIQNLRHGVPAVQTALVALQLAYLPFAIGWLAVGPVSDLISGQVSHIYIGAYLAFLTVLVYTAQAVLSVRGQPRLLLRLLPLGLSWAPWVVWWH